MNFLGLNLPTNIPVELLAKAMESFFNNNKLKNFTSQIYLQRFLIQ